MAEWCSILYSKTMPATMNMLKRQLFKGTQLPICSICAAVSIIAATAIIICSCSSGEKREGYVTSEGFAQGSTYRIIYQLPQSADTSSFCKMVEDSIALWFNRIDRSVSGYNSESTLSRYNSGTNSNVDKIFADIFEESYKYYKLSGGLFDPSAAPLFDLWGFGFKNGTEPLQATIDSIKNCIGMDKLVLERSAGGAYVHNPDSLTSNIVQLNFNAIAQGYTVDYMGKGLEQMGIENYLVEVGGEVMCRGVNSRGNNWSIGIDKPVDGNNISGEMIQAVIEVSGKGVVTSGNYRKFYVKDGVKYSHTIDPTTGRPVTHSLLSATVVATTGTEADAYATIFMVMGVEKSKEFLAAHPELDALLIYQNGESLEQFATPGIVIK